MNYIKRWAPLVALTILFLFVMNVKADPDRFWGEKLQAEPATYQKADELADIREYLGLEEAQYILKETHPRSLIIYYNYDEDWQQTIKNWTCEKMNTAFPKAQLKSLLIVDIGDATRGKTDFGC